MGGNIGRGNHSPLAEYNIAGDPEAAQVVFHSGLPIKVAPLEIGNKAHLLPDQMAKVKECGEVGDMLYALFHTFMNQMAIPASKFTIQLL